MFMKKILVCCLFIFSGMVHPSDNSSEVALRLCRVMSERNVYRAVSASAAVEVCMLIDKNNESLPQGHEVLPFYDVWKECLKLCPFEMDQMNHRASVVCSVLSISREVLPVLQPAIIKWKEAEEHCKVLDLVVAHVSALHMAERLKQVQ